MKFSNLILTLTLLLSGLASISCSHRPPQFKVGISQCSNDVWRQKMNEEILREASLYSQELHIDLRSASENSQLQIRQIDSMINEGINLLIVSPNEAKELTPVVEKAYNRGIPVLVVDRKILSNKYTAFIGANNFEVGNAAGSFISRELKGHGTVVEFTGQMGATAAIERHKGFIHALKKSPDIHILAQIEGGWDGYNVERQVDSILNLGIVPDIVYSHTDRMGVKIFHAAKKRGIKLKVVGIDGLARTDGGLANVERGELAASFIYPTGGERVIQIARKILLKEPFERDTELKSAVIDASTARIFRIQSEQIHESEKHIDKLGAQLADFLSRNSMQNMLLLAAVTIIVLIGLVLIVSLRWYFLTIKRNKELRLQKQKLEDQRDQLVSLSKELQETTQSKLSFFTEVSHDLRTPLTLILAPVEQLQADTRLTPDQHSLIQIIRTNANMMMRLVSQTLDFRKFEAGQLKLHLQPTDLPAAISQWCEPFKALARKKIIRYQLNLNFASSASPMGLIDVDKMESVVYNLLSNAFKFTPEGGRITVTAEINSEAEEGRLLTIVIEDSGQGIAPEKIGRIFDRFYQTDVSHEGSGIGLATVKAYVELHKGMIVAESAPGKGARFTINVPCAEQAANLPPTLHHEAAETTDSEFHTATLVDTEANAEMSNAASSTSVSGTETLQPSAETSAKSAVADQTEAKGTLQPKDDKSLEAGKGVQTNNDGDEPKPTVLMIDDNEDIRSYVRILLGSDYCVEEAGNGQEGLAKARQIMPDAVVCDVMMPVMDGWECCRRLKDEWQTSHIPVMLLTACTLNEQRIMGFDSGADAYIEKPFSPDMFRARLRNLIANRRRLKAFFGDKSTIEKADVSDLDKGFAERFRTLIEKNMKNSDLSVEDLATDMGLGRSQLYRKVKSLTGYSPVELIRVARLKKAAELLTRTDKTVSEIAYEVGFSTPSYLTKCFRDYFGVSPSDYAKSHA